MIHWEHTWKAPPHKVLPQAGFVCKCCNADMDKMAAAKITKDAPNVVQPAYLKITILKQLQCLNPDMCNIVKWNGFFFDKDQICLNFELLDQSLYDYMESKYGLFP